jgi:hypothetical protein
VVQVSWYIGMQVVQRQNGSNRIFCNNKIDRLL